MCASGVDLRSLAICENGCQGRGTLTYTQQSTLEETCNLFSEKGSTWQEDLS